MSGIVLWACERAFPLGTLPPGASRFRVLPQCGDDSVELHAGGAPTNCRIYVEGELYHVRAWFASATTGECLYGGAPPLSPVLVVEALR